MAEAVYLVGSRVLGTAKAPRGAQSLAYFCPECGELWGRIALEARWQVLYVSCERHRDAEHPWRLPGSLLSALQDPALWESAARLDVMPLEALRRECLIHLKEYENERDNDVGRP